MWRAREPSIAIAAKGLRRARPRGRPDRPPICTRAATAARSRIRTHALAAIVATLHDADGAVAVPGFYDEVEPLAAADRAALGARAFDEEAYRAEVGVPALHGEPGYSTLERLWARPTLEVNGCAAAGRSPSSRAMRARTSRAGSCPARSPERRARGDRSARRARDAARRRGRASRGGPAAVPAYAIAADHAGDPRRARARCATVYPDREPLLVRIGGTLPAAVLFERDPRPEDAALLLLDRRREPPRAERVLPARPARRGDAGVGRAVAAPGIGREMRPSGIVGLPSNRRCVGARLASKEPRRAPSHQSFGIRRDVRRPREPPEPSAALAGNRRTKPAGTPKRGGSITIARIEDSQSFDKTNVFQNESIWLAEQIMEPLYIAAQRRQDAEAVARDELHDVERRQDVHVQAPPGRQVLERQADDVRRRQVLDRRRARAVQGLGLPRRCDQEHHGAEPEHGRLPPEVPVGAVPGRHRAVRERDHPEELRRRDARGVLQAPGRHRARSCGTSASSASR